MALKFDFWTKLQPRAGGAFNKFIRKFGRKHTRKDSRLHSNQNLMNMLLISSDLYISTIRTTKAKLSEELPSEVVKMLSKSNINEGNDDGGDETDDNDNDDKNDEDENLWS